MKTEVIQTFLNDNSKWLTIFNLSHLNEIISNDDFTILLSHENFLPLFKNNSIMYTLMTDVEF